MSESLAGKVALITGASGNIGMATAARFLASGARVVLVDRNLDACAALMPEKDRAIAIAADVTSASDYGLLVSTSLAKFGRLDVVFANAGVEGVVRHVEEYPEDTYDQVMAVNTKGVFLALKHLVPAMSDGGSFVITSSIMGLKGAPINSAYTASKHAVVGLMRAAAIDFAPRGIRVNCVHPGLVNSAMLNRLFAGHEHPEEKRTAALASVKLGRFIEPADIAGAVLFLASDDSKMLTGQSLVVDGGQLL